MTKQVQRRRGTASQHTSFTGADGEISVNTTNKSVHVHDGVTTGGIEAARADLENVSSASVLGAAGITATTAELNYTDGVTSSIQTQLNTKAPKNNATFTGTTVVPTADINGGTIDGTVIGGSSAAAGRFTTVTASSNVGIGTSSPAGMLQISSTFPTLTLDETNTDAAYQQTQFGLDDGSFRIQTRTSTNAFVSNDYLIDKDSSGATDHIWRIADNEAMRIDSSGNVGIGTGSPSDLLDLSSSDPRIRLTNTGSGHCLVRTGGTDASLILDADAGNTVAGSDIIMRIDATERMRIDSSGNVGIGTAAPAAKLELASGNAGLGILAASNRLRFTDNDTTLISGQTTGAIEWYTSDTSAPGVHAYIGTLGTNTGAAILTFGTGVGGSAAERMRIDSLGNVGIGTSSPSEKLSVEHSGNVAIEVKSTGTGDADAVVIIDAADTGEAILEFRQDGVAKAAIEWFSAGSPDFNFRTEAGTNGVIDFQPNNSLAMRIDASGNVGIGTSSPAQPLTIQATIPMIQLVDSNLATRVANIGGDNGNVTIDIDPNQTAASSYFSVDVDSTECMRIGAGGTMLVGMTSSSSGADGCRILGVGTITATRDGSNAAVFNRKTSDGSIVEFRKNDAVVGSIGAASGGIYFGSSSSGTERMRIDASGNVGIGTTVTPVSSGITSGLWYQADSYFVVARDNAAPIYANRTGTDGEISVFRKNGVSVGFIGNNSSSAGLEIYSTVGGGIGCYSAGIAPVNGSGSFIDNSKDLGSLSYRWDDVYATNGTIQTSDRNEKQDIEALSDAEQRVAVACKGLLRKFRWKSSVEEKGDDARIHFGIIAQDLQEAFTAEGLDAGRYAMFISTTWWETQTEVPAVAAADAVLDEEGNVVTEAVEAKEAYTRTDTYETLEDAPEGATERTRLGVRYPELLAFIIAAI